MDTKTVRAITADDKTVLQLHVWDDAEQPRGVIQLLHGMAEHAARYDDFARAMNARGFIIYAHDHRGHGQTAGSVEKLGYIGEDGFNRITQDAYELTKLIKGWHPGLPIFIMGHSFGSFIVQEYITRYGNEVQGVILSGSALIDGPQVTLGKLVATLMAMLMDESKQSPLLNKLNFGSYNKRIDSPASANSWLSRDTALVKKYDDDPYCGTIFTINFYKHFLTGLTRLYKHEKLAAIPKSLPILILSGDMDPVGQYGNGPKRLNALYNKLGLTQVKLKLYPDARHEIINETNHAEVIKDIGDWAEERLN